MGNNLSVSMDLILQRQRGHFVEMEMSADAFEQRIRQNSSISTVSSSTALTMDTVEEART